MPALQKNVLYTNEMLVADSTPMLLTAGPSVAALFPSKRRVSIVTLPLSLNAPPLFVSARRKNGGREQLAILASHTEHANETKTHDNNRSIDGCIL